jgi:hypothetical protein
MLGNLYENHNQRTKATSVRSKEETSEGDVEGGRDHTGDAEDTAYRVVVKTLVQAEKDKSTGLLTYYNGNKVETFRVLRGDFETEPNPGVYEVP